MARAAAVAEVVVAGHLCLDIVPELRSAAPLEPGALLEAGPASFSSGGAVANVGVALARLGLAPALVGRVGDDHFGAILRDQLSNGVGEALVETVPAPGESTSYSVVISPPGLDRTFLHHPGCNDTFHASHLQVQRWTGSRLLHFGYPPLMSSIISDGGVALAGELERLRSAGVVVSLDMAMPDPGGASGQVDWRSFLATVLPQVDLFLPSWEEIGFMLEPSSPCPEPSLEGLAEVSDRLLGLGPAVVGLKLGERGLYLRSAGDARAARAGSGGLPPGWSNRELLSPNFSVAVSGTTGAGDATIAGLLAGLLKGLPVEQALTFASAVGAHSVEGPGSTAGIPPWQQIIDRIGAGWSRAPTPLADEFAQAWGRREGPDTSWKAVGVVPGPADAGGRR